MLSRESRFLCVLCDLCGETDVSRYGTALVFEKIMKKIKRKHSQIFLTNHRIVRRLVDLSQAGPGDTVLEIGPGKGILTKNLLLRGVKLVAVEIDASLCALLRGKFAQEIQTGQLELHHADFLRCKSTQLVPAGSSVVANLPYHISTPIVLKLLEDIPHFSRMLLTLQQEFVSRLTAEPGTKAYGALSVFLRCRARARRALKIGRRSFRPSPTVDSAAALIQAFNQPEIPNVPGPDFSHFVQMLFSQRRKKLIGALAILSKKSISREAITSLLNKLELDGSQRAGMFSEVELWKLYLAWQIRIKEERGLLEPFAYG